MEKGKKKTKGNKIFNKFLNGVEKVGNKLPHPITLFGILCLGIIILSAILSKFGITATGELINRTTLELEEQTITVVSLLSREGLAYMIKSAVTNFTSFAPLGVVLVAMLGIGVAEGSGYIGTVLKKSIAVTPKKLITPMVVFLGIMSNVASDAGYVILVPLGALIFMSCGRHPLAGLAAGFAGVSGGFSANLILGTIDPMLAGLSTEAAKIIDPSYMVQASANFYFMFVSTFLITILGTIVTDKIIEPRLGTYDKSKCAENIDTNLGEITSQEKKALKYANLTLLGLIIFIVAIALPENSFLRNPENGSLMNNSPFIDGLVLIISILFFIPSVVYGKIVGKYKNETDVCIQLSQNMSSMGGYIALSFVCAQFIKYFEFTNLGTILAINGADFLSSTGANGIVLMIGFILLTGFINLFMGSASAKWAIMAPIFIPMFMKLGYSPELVQVAYRIGDSTTNIISPLMTYFAIIVAFAQKYDKDSGIGTLISTMMPYSITFMIGWALLLIIWMLVGLPIGPGAGLVFGL